MGMKRPWILLTVEELQMFPNKGMYQESEEKLYFLSLNKPTPIFESGCMKTIPRDLRPIHIITYNTSGSAGSLIATEIRPSCIVDILKI